jgi:hypothetical protein
MSLKQLVDLDFNSVSKAINLPTPTATGDAATKGYVDSAVEGLAWKDSVRTSSVGNINLSSPGASIDGISLSAGDRFLAKDQSTGSQNGIYVWNGAATPATRAPDASTAAELEQAVVTVEEGTNAGSSFRQTAVNFTLDSGTVSWTSFGTGAPAASETTAGIAEIATQAETDTGTDDARFVTPLKLKTWSGALKRHNATFGDGAATQYDITHNFNTRDVIIQVKRVATPWDVILCDMEALDANTVRLRFSSAPTSNQFRVTILA